MYVKILTLFVATFLFGLSYLNAQLSFKPAEAEIAAKKLFILAEFGQSSGKPSKLSRVEIALDLHIESEVKVEIRDALGKKLFESLAIYPEGKQEVKVSIGNMEQGLYFIQLSTDLESQTQMVLIEK